MAESLVLRTAKAMHRVDPGVISRPDFGSLPESEQQRYLKMASTALSVAFHEPVDAMEASLSTS